LVRVDNTLSVVIWDVVANVLRIQERFYLLVTNRDQLTARGTHSNPLPIRCTCGSATRACCDA